MAEDGESVEGMMKGGRWQVAERKISFGSLDELCLGTVGASTSARFPLAEMARILLGRAGFIRHVYPNSCPLPQGFHRPFLAVIMGGGLALSAVAKDRGDIGSPQPEGKAVQQGNLWMITGGGADFSGSSDQFHFVSSPVTGDCILSAKIFSVGDERAHEWAKAALMIRANDSAGAPHASIAVGHGGTAVFVMRTTPGGNTRSERAPKMSFPIFLRLERKRNDFAASYSQDGKTWVQVGKTTTIPMTSESLAGMAVTSHAQGVPCTAAFSNYVLKR